MIGTTALFTKDEQLKPIECLPSMRKLLPENIYDYLCWNSILPNAGQSCRKESRDTLLIAKAILRNRRACKRLKVGWVYYKKAYMTPHSRVKEVVELVQLADNIKKYYCLETWNSGKPSS